MLLQVAFTLLQQGKVKVNAPLGNITRDDVVVNKMRLLHCKSMSMENSTVSADFITLDKVVNHDQKSWANQGNWSDCQDSQTESAQERKDKIYVLFKA